MSECVSWHRNNHKTAKEMQRINFFSLPCEPGDLQSSSRAEAHRERRLRRARSSLESYHTCWFHRCVGDSADAVFHCALGFPQQGRNLRHVQSVPQSITGLLLSKQKFYLSSTQHQTTISICVFLHPRCKWLEHAAVLLASLPLCSCSIQIERFIKKSVWPVCYFATLEQRKVDSSELRIDFH